MKTIFETNHLVFNGIKNEWIKHLAIFNGDLTSIDLTIDSRFCYVKNKREQYKFLGTIDSISFPIEFPITTIEGNIINGGYKPVSYNE